jgi:plasmid stability protein
MAALLVKDVPARLHRRLKALARQHRRSLGREVLTILEEATGDSAGPPSIEEIDLMRVRGRRPLRQGVVTAAIREGRP